MESARPDLSREIRLGLVGIGKIARDQHLPAIVDNDRFELVATASRNAQVDGIPSHGDIDALIAGGHQLDAISLCTPPGGRFDQAAAAIAAGLHLMLEKPPAATIREITTLAEQARARGVTLFTTWHSREAAGVEPARKWLAGRRVEAVRITWKEDIRRWHPGQEWILAAGGFGVFDPGINALSIATRILPGPVILESASMEVPENRASPLRAELEMRSGAAPVRAEFDFLQTGPQTWDIEVDTDQGTLRLAMGGNILRLPGGAPVRAPDAEYPRLYARFAELVAGGEQDIDIRPFELVADAFLIGARRTGPAFAF
ncbi:Gfo/Idh/MocA family protein [Stakelama saccharophila]|uniref:Gfo/Idh/MocA family oxidoreductase n=1 Tax=Stakelama saccharophila TaxID=3075605 RepID=A0ABZ0B843_9SPHN|nr:Gfo/Idh/MocA family oxidoreductase [Stakelama sp. W311]WNO53564.1 Gfo/Idh/MocA family oxidoreductase [Stakelama sp. W311]